MPGQSLFLNCNLSYLFLPYVKCQDLTPFHLPHVKLPRHLDLDKYLCVRTTRTVRNDNTIACNGKLYQIEEKVRTRKVTVQERLNGSMHIVVDAKSLKYKEITERSGKETTTKRSSKPGKPYVPPKDHPWRRWQCRKSTTKSMAHDD